MRTTLLCALVSAAVLAGCRQPADVELQTEENITEMEILPVIRPDTVIVTKAVDTTAVLPSEQVSYGGQIVVHKVTVDAGYGKVDSFAYSRAVVSDSTIRYLLRLVGYNGIDLGTLTVNGTPMVKVPHQITVRSVMLRDTVLSGGVEYVADLSQKYQPSALYTWSALSTSTGAMSVSITSPGKLDVLSPQGGGVYSPDRDLLLAWSGNGGQIQIVVSIVEPLTRRSVPVLALRPKTNTGRGLLPASVLRQLLQQFPRVSSYVFTFILFNRKEISLPQSRTGTVLVQAAEVHNCYIQLR